MVDLPEEHEDDAAQDFTAGLEPEEDQDPVDGENDEDTGGDDNAAESDDDSGAADEPGQEDDQETNAKSGEDESTASEDEAAEEVAPEDEEPAGDDHQDAIAALKDLGARLDLNKHERVWRIFFYEQHGDEALEQIHGLPSLKELWLLHTRVTKEGAQAVGERLEGVKVYHG